MIPCVVLAFFVGGCLGALVALLSVQSEFEQRGELPGNQTREWRE